MTDQSGCTATDNKIISVNPQPTGNSITIPQCESTPPGQATFNLTASNFAVGSGLSVAWFNDIGLTSPISNPNAFNSSATTVYAVVSNANCSSLPIPIILNDTQIPESIRWLVALSSIPLFGFVTAFGIAPNVPSLEDIQVEDVILDLSIPDVIHDTQENQIFWHQENIRRGDTIAAVLSRLDISDQDSNDFLQAVRGSRAMKHLKPGKTIYAQTSSDGELLGLRYVFGNEELFLMEKNDDEFKIIEQSLELDNRIQMKAGVISSSLFAATDIADVPNNIAAHWHRYSHRKSIFIVDYTAEIASLSCMKC